MLKRIRQTLGELYGEHTAAKVRLLYGGSVNPDNTTAYLKLADVGGLLIGGASLNYAEFGKIMALASAKSE